jgi:membrane-bound lytic murein transglycosylase D
VVIDRAVERTGYVDFWELRRRSVLPRETANYVPIVLAMIIVTKNARQYGLEGLEVESPLEYDTVEITSATHLLLISDLAECTVAQVRDLNPALLKNIAPPGYTLHVPRGSGAAVSAALETVPAERRASWRVHRLSEGESLAGVAQRYRVTASSILAANRSPAGGPEAGDLLLIPTAAPLSKAPARAASARRAARKPASAKPATVQRASL